MYSISVKTFANLEPLLAAELAALGATDIFPGKRVVHCTGDLSLVYRLNYELRTGLRVLVQLTSFKCRKPDDLHRKAMEFAWEDFMGLENTFSIDPNVRSAQYRHPHFAALKLKDAIADRFVKLTGRRPDVNPDQPDVKIHLHIDEEKVTISLDSSGNSLNQRGYRDSGGMAPLNEVLAAAMIQFTGWKGDTPFYDPMCGSGTLAIEAAMIAGNIPSQWKRPRFGFMSWPAFDKTLWKTVVQDAHAKTNESTVPVYASDSDRMQLKQAARNISLAGLTDRIHLSTEDFFVLDPHSDPGILVLNPPYGERMDEEQILHFYKRIGESFKHRWSGFKAWVISSNIEALKQIGLKSSKKVDLFNGNLPCRFQGYELYAGSRRKPAEAEIAE